MTAETTRCRLEKGDDLGDAVESYVSLLSSKMADSDEISLVQRCEFSMWVLQPKMKF